MNFWRTFSKFFKEQLALLDLEAADASFKFLTRSNLNLLDAKKSRPLRRRVTGSHLKRLPSCFEAPQEIDLKNIWNSLVTEYFPDRHDLSLYSIDWSRRRQKRTLASCNIRKLQINVAQEMSLPECAAYLPALIYHEMCHAVLGDKVGRAGSKRMWHGPAFRQLEKRHPDIEKLDLWIKKGGWSKAVRSFRAKQYHKARKLAAVDKITV